MSNYRQQKQLQQLQRAQQPQDQGQDMTAALAQLASLLGIQHNLAIQPEQMRALQLENEQRQTQQSTIPIDNAYKQAQTKHLEDYNHLSPHDIINFQALTGKSLPPELLKFAPLEYSQFFQDQQKQQEVQRQAQMAEEQNRITGPQPTPKPFVPSGLADASLPDILSSIPGFIGNVVGRAVDHFIPQSPLKGNLPIGPTAPPVKTPDAPGSPTPLKQLQKQSNLEAQLRQYLNS